jgi:hypothetical protein
MSSRPVPLGPRERGEKPGKGAKGAWASPRAVGNPWWGAVEVAPVPEGYQKTPPRPVPQIGGEERSGPRNGTKGRDGVRE